MSSSVISLSHLTKDYGKGRGIFDVSLEVMPGEVFGYLGTNGSGKTTTIRNMMGFLKPTSGTVRVDGMDPWTKAPELMRKIAYIPGEIAFPSLSSGSAFFKVQAEYLGVRDLSRMQQLIDLLALDPTAGLKRMSKGMKQKTAVVAALMAPRDLLILDEPTTGLDPLMRENFLDLIRQEKAEGHTVFMSSHIFEEIEEVCDRVGIIQNGRLREVLSLSEFRASAPRKMELVFQEAASAEGFARGWQGSIQEGDTVRCSLPPEEMNRLMHALNGLPVKAVHEEHTSLEEYFMHGYREGQR